MRPPVFPVVGLQVVEKKRKVVEVSSQLDSWFQGCELDLGKLGCFSLSHYCRKLKIFPPIFGIIN